MIAYNPPTVARPIRGDVSGSAALAALTSTSVLTDIFSQPGPPPKLTMANSPP